MQIVLKALNLLQETSLGSRSKPDSAQGVEAPPAPVPATKAENRISVEPQSLAVMTPVVRLKAPEHATPSPGSSQAAPQGGSEPQGVVATVGASGSEKTILFVEDDPVVLKLYKNRLNREGFRVEIADDGAVAIEKLPQIKPDLVVLDLMLPKVQGIDVLKFIRAERELKSTPVLVLSNVFLDKLAAKAMEAGATKGILKAECTPAKLIELVKGLLGRTPAGSVVSEQALTANPYNAANGETTVWLKENHPVRNAPIEIPKIRRICLDYIKAAGTKESFGQLETFYRSVRRLSARAGLSGLTKICEVASALEALLFEFVFGSSQATPSSLQSIVQAVDCLDRLFQSGDSKFSEPRLKPRVLVVDDDAVCVATSVAVLKRAHFDPVGVKDPKESLRILQTGCFDLIILDIDMPQLDGFQVCEELRQMPQHKSCPVMYVTVSNDFRDRARSVLAGGNDLLTKPVTPMELVLKSVLHVVNSLPRPAATPREALSEGQETSSLPSAARSTLEQARPNGEWEPFLTPSRPPQPIPEMSGAATAIGASHAEEPGETPQRKNGASAEAGPSAEQPVPGKESTMQTAPGEPDAASGIPSQEQELGNEVEQFGQESAMRREALAIREKERQTFIDRIYTAESDLCREQSRVKRRDRAIENLQKELEALRSNGGKLEVVAQDSRELGAAAASAILVEQAQKQAQSRCEELEKELAELRQELSSKCSDHEKAALDSATRARELEQRLAQQTGEQQASAESLKRIQDLEDRLGQKAAELQNATATLETHAKDRTHVEAELRQQFDTVTAGQKQAQERCTRLEQELGGLKQGREELNAKLTKEQQASAESATRIRDLEDRLGQKAAELQKATAKLKRGAIEQEQTVADLKKQLDEAVTARAQVQAQSGQLQQELGVLRETHEQLAARLADKEHKKAESAKLINELEALVSKLQTTSRGEEGCNPGTNY